MPRTPTGAAVLQPEVTDAIAEAVLDELAELGYGRLRMESVARRAGVGKSALYRRWPGKQEMVVAVLSAFSVPLAEIEPTGSLRGDVRAFVGAVHGWLTHPRFARILPDLVAEGSRTPALADATRSAIGGPRRAAAAAVLHRAAERGELAPGLDLELALDLLAAPVHWRLSVLGRPVTPSYLDDLATLLVRAFTPPPGGTDTSTS